jgi:hypothetical protein
MPMSQPLRNFLPLAIAILEFHDEHYPRDDAGQLAITPAQSLENWQDARDPPSEIAGLNGKLDNLLALPANSLSATRVGRRF